MSSITAFECLKQLCYHLKLRVTHYIQLLDLENNSWLYQMTPDALKDGLNCEITQQTMPKPWIQTRLLTSFTFKPYTSQTVGEGRNEARESRMKQKRGERGTRGALNNRSRCESPRRFKRGTALELAPFWWGGASEAARSTTTKRPQRERQQERALEAVGWGFVRLGNRPSTAELGARGIRGPAGIEKP